MIEQLMTPEVTRERPVVLIGGNGTVGYGIAQGIEAQFGPDSALIVSRSSISAVDILEPATLEDLLQRTTPSVIFHLVAATNVNQCEANPQWAERLNVTGTENVVNAAINHGGIPVVYISTDFVFSGQGNRPKAERDKVNPVSVYGRTKAAGEAILINSGLSHLILRISFPWYPVSQHLANPAIKDAPYWMIKTLLANRDVPAFTNTIGSWTSMDHLGRQIASIIDIVNKGEYSILHIGGSCHTPYELANAIHHLLEQVYGISNIGRVIETVYSPGSGQAARPEQGGLDTSLSHSLGFEPYSILDLLSTVWINEQIAKSLRTN